MRIKTYAILLLALSVCTTTQAQTSQPSLANQQKPVNQDTKAPLYKNSKAPIEARVNDLIGRMTVQEKIGQLMTQLGWEMYDKKADKISVSEKFKKAVAEQHIGNLWATLRADPWTQKTLATGLNPYNAAKATNMLQQYNLEHSRLGIPVFLAEECPHGHMAIGTTVFPTAIGQGSTWNPALIGRMAETISREARLQGGHIGYGPVLDLAREPRWSRVEETYGEDPFLNSMMGAAMVKGFQGSNIGSGVNVISTLKHFTAYGVPEGGHNGGPVSVGLRELYQSYLPPFKAAVDAGALSIMTAYNAIDGVPCTANPFLLKEVLRDQWGFQGFVVSDLGSVNGLAGNHGIAGSLGEAAELALNAGVDNDLGGSAFAKLEQSIASNTVTQARLDEAVKRVLTLKFKMGLFENPYVDPNTAKKQVRNQSTIAVSRQVAQESMILLKNEKQTLPLKKQITSIAVIGPNANNIYNQLGDYTAPQPENNIVTPLEGIRAKLPANVKVNYVKGCDIRDSSNVDIAGAVKAAAASDVAVVVLGGSSARDFKTEYISTGAATVGSGKSQQLSDMESGEGFDRQSLDLMGKQLDLLKAVVATGKPVVLVFIGGRPLNMNWPAENVDAILYAWYPGQEGGHAIADVLFGDYNPAGRLPISIPRNVGQLPVYYNDRNQQKHDYVEGPAAALYGFGHGLSYSSFAYDNLKIEVAEQPGAIPLNPMVRVSVAVTNTGTRNGDEVVQLYLHDEKASTVVPLKQLRAFKRLHLKAGETQVVNFELQKEDLMIYDASMRHILEKGTFKVMIGASSRDIRLEGIFTIEKDHL
jgi:beta-glucosidase